MDEVKLDNLAPLLLEYEQIRRDADRYKRAAEILRGRIEQELGDATEGKVGDRTVCTWRATGQFNASRLAKERPELAAKYTREVVRQELDVERLAAELPELHQAYRSRRFEWKGLADG